MKRLATTLGKGLYDLTRGLEKSEIETVTRRFVELLASRQRLGLLPDIIRAYETASKKAEGVETIAVTTASEPSPHTAESIVKALEKTAGAAVEIEWKTDPTLIGGAVIRRRDTLLDASVKRRLELLKRHLTPDI